MKIGSHYSGHSGSGIAVGIIIAMLVVFVVSLWPMFIKLGSREHWVLLVKRGNDVERQQMANESECFAHTRLFDNVTCYRTTNP